MGDSGTDVYRDEDGSVAAMVELLDRKQNATEEYAEAEDPPISDISHGRAEAFGKSVELAKRILDQPECSRCGVTLDLASDDRCASGWVWKCRHCHHRRTIVFDG